MGRLFRDWRYALLWVLGITALAVAYAADSDSYQKSQVASAPATLAMAAPSLPAPKPAKAPEKAPDQESGPGFGEPVMDTVPFDPNPVEPAPSPSVSASAPAAAASPADAAVSPSVSSAP